LEPVILVEVYFVTSKLGVLPKIFTLTPTLSQREREPDAALSLWERVGVRAKSNSNPHERRFYLD